MKSRLFLMCVLSAGCGGKFRSDPRMGFFVSSRGSEKGGDFRLSESDADGLAGADALCASLAAAADSSFVKKTWRAYLSTSTVNARDRIGTGPWRNAKGIVIAESVEHLHEENGAVNALGAATTLTEHGDVVPGRIHDVLTGTDVNGTAFPSYHCNNWTASISLSSARVGHSDRAGGDLPPARSWNSAHATGGCEPWGVTSVRSGGGTASIYCFAVE